MKDNVDTFSCRQLRSSNSSLVHERRSLWEYTYRFWLFSIRFSQADVDRSWTQLPFETRTRRFRRRGDPGNFPSYASTASRGKERREGAGMRESLSNPSSELMFSCQLVDGNGVLPSRRGKDGRGRSCPTTWQEVNSEKEREEADRRSTNTDRYLTTIPCICSYVCVLLNLVLASGPKALVHHNTI